MEKIKINFTEDECNVMLDIIYGPYRDITLAYLIRSLEKKYDTTTIKKVTDYLFSSGIIENIDNKIYIYQKKLRDLIDEQILVNKWYDYFNQWHFCHW